MMCAILLRLVTIFGLAIAISLLSAMWLDVGLFDVLALSVALAPLILLKKLAAGVNSFHNPCSILFTKYFDLLNFATSVLWCFLLYGMYKYSVDTGLWTTAAVYMVGLVASGPFYALLKGTVPGEIWLYPVALISIGLFVFVIA